jgi:hypothetical protein
MQALEEPDLSRAEAASAQFDAELWRISDRLKDEADAKGNQKHKDKKKPDAGRPKLQVMPDALPKPLLSNLSVMSLELSAGLLMAKKLTGDARKLYSQAAQEEKTLGYREPPAYIRPVDETEAAAFMVASDWTGAKAAYKDALVERPALRLSALWHWAGQRASWRHHSGHDRVHRVLGDVEIRRLRSSPTHSCARLPRLSQRSRSQRIAVQNSDLKSQKAKPEASGWADCLHWPKESASR